MKILSDPARFLVNGQEPLRTALERISAGKLRCVFVVGDKGDLIGSLTDGDFRRWLETVALVDMETPCREAANEKCVWLLQKDIQSSEIDFATPGVDAVPVVDDLRRVVGILLPHGRDFAIADKQIRSGAPVFVIAEIGLNHDGEPAKALQLIDEAVNAGADAVKFQLRNMETLYRTRANDESEDLGTQYSLDVIREANLSLDDMFAAMNYAKTQGVIPLCTPWDVMSAQNLEDFGVAAYKIASADLTNHPLIERLVMSQKPLLVSTGMSTEKEIEETVELLKRSMSNFALLHCQSSYPAPVKDINLSYMDRLSEIGDCHVGYSGHERGFHIVLASVALGARVIEKHITLDRNSRGNDHRVSLEPPEFTEMVQKIRDVEDSLGSAQPRILTQGETLNRLALSKSLVASRKIDQGRKISREDIEVRSPGRGLQPNRQQELIGRQINRSLKKGDFFFESDLTGEEELARPYFFPRRWGLPVRFHDWHQLSEKSNPDFLEFHLSYRDLEVDPEIYLKAQMPYGLVVHSPDLFAGDLILDLANESQSVRDQSIIELQRVIDATRLLSPRFELDEPPIVVASLGGSTFEAPEHEGRRSLMYERLLSSLEAVDQTDVNLLAQTLPPFPWYLGGQRFCNLFVDPFETAVFAKQSGIGICLDTAHTKLAANHLGISFSEGTSVLLEVTEHLHLVDAAGVDKEGLQILEGEIDWGVLCKQLRVLKPNIGFIPEIWQGHVDDGREFWRACSKLESLMA